MKKQIFSLGLMLAATFTLTNCTKEIENPSQQPESAGVPFEIVASTVDTKTANDGMTTKWVAGDAINLFHAVSGEAEYVNNNSFSISEEDLETKKFKGTLGGELDSQKSYDWFAFYPYSSYIKTPANVSSGYMAVGSKAGVNQIQEGNDSRAHIAGENYPVAGRAKAVPAGIIPEIQMTHLSSLLEVKVTNLNEDDLSVKSVSFAAPAEVDIVGTYYINFADETPSYISSGSNYVSNIATLTVNDGAAIAKGQSASYYLAVKPFDVTSGQKLTLSVNGYSKEITLENDITFTSGKIKTLNFGYDKVLIASEGLKLPWYEDFSSEDLSKYEIVSSNAATAIYPNDNLAGGEAPELLIAKNQGSMTAVFDTEGYVGTLTLTYVTNNDSRITVSSPTEGVNVAKGDACEYLINIPESGVEELTLQITNTNVNSNVRIDNIRLVKGIIENQTISFDPAVDFSFELGSTEASTFVAPTLSGAKTTVTYSSSNPEVAEVNPATGAITLGEIAGSATITAVAEATDKYKSATTSYDITLTKAVSGDITKGESYSYTFTAAVWKANGSATLGALSWNIAGDGAYWGWDTNNVKGQQLGSSSKPYTNLTISTSAYEGGVEAIKVSTSGASSISAKLTVTVNGKQYGETVSLSSSNNEYSFVAPTEGMQEGEIVLSYTQTSSKAIYIKSIQIN